MKRLSQRLADTELGVKLLAGFGLLVGLLVVLSLAAFANTRANESAREAVTHSVTVISDANAALAALLDMESGYRGYLLTGRSDFLEPYAAGRSRYQTALVRLRDETTKNSAQAARWQRVLALAETWQQQVTEPGMALRRQVDAGQLDRGAIETMVSTGEGKRQFDAIRGTFANAISEEERLLGLRTVQAAAADGTLKRGDCLTSSPNRRAPDAQHHATRYAHS